MRRYDMARPGWEARRRQQILFVLETIATLAAAIGVAVGLWFCIVVILVLAAPGPGQ